VAFSGDYIGHVEYVTVDVMQALFVVLHLI